MESKNNLRQVYGYITALFLLFGLLSIYIRLDILYSFTTKCFFKNSKSSYSIKTLFFGEKIMLTDFFELPIKKNGCTRNFKSFMLKPKRVDIAVSNYLYLIIGSSITSSTSNDLSEPGSDN